MRTLTIAALSATVLAIVGCGGASGGYDNASRPPAVLTISIALNEARVAVAPARIGAGPAVLLIANQSGRSREVMLTAPAGASRSCVEADASSGPISPQSTARVQLPLVEGTCMVGVRGATLRPARLTVGPPRPSSQQDLLQP
jgi:hypothetical protein